MNGGSENTRKIAIAVMAIFTLVLGVVAIVIGLRLQDSGPTDGGQSSATTSASATTATRTTISTTRTGVTITTRTSTTTTAFVDEQIGDCTIGGGADGCFTLSGDCSFGQVKRYSKQCVDCCPVGGLAGSNAPYNESSLGNGPGTYCASPAPGECAQIDFIWGDTERGQCRCAPATTRTTTVAPRACGAACTATSQCGTGHTCEDSPYDNVNGNVCVKNTCRTSPCSLGACGDVIQCGGNCGPNANSACPENHTCSDGKCVLNTCLPPNVCTPDSSCGNIVQCGEPCGPGNSCPVDHTCSSGTCVLNTCLTPGKCNGSCTPVALPKTALISDDVDRVLIAVVILLFGYLMLRLKLVDNLTYSFGSMRERREHSRLHGSRDQFERRITDEIS